MESWESGRAVGAPMEPEVDLKSPALTVVENLRLLVGGAVVAAVVALVATSFLPARFISEAVIDPFASFPESNDAAVARLIRNVPAILSSASVLETARKASAIPESELPSNAVTARAGRVDGMIMLSVAADSAVQAQRLAQAILEATYAASQPEGEEKARLEKEQRRLLADIHELESVAAKLKIAIDTVGNADTGRIGDLASGQSAVIGSMTILQRDLDSNQRRLAGLTAEAIVQPPSLPTRHSGPRRVTWVAVAILGTLSILLIGIFLLQAWRSTPISPEHAARIDKLREKFGLKAREQIP